jgi:hypothetical protein
VGKELGRAKGTRISGCNKTIDVQDLSVLYRGVCLNLSPRTLI